MFRWFELYTCAKTAGEDGQEVVAVSPYMITTQPNMSSTEVRLTICPSSLRNNTVYVRYYILLANLIVMALGPLLIMSVLNTLLYKAIKRREVVNVGSPIAESCKIRNMLNVRLI